MQISFHKMNGLGNDFVIIEDHCALTPAQISHIADRRLGVGCDQLIMIKPPLEPSYDAQMIIFNADGTPAGACGNATRCVAWLIGQKLNKNHLKIMVYDKILNCLINKDSVAVTMGIPATDAPSIPYRGGNAGDVSFPEWGLENGFCVNVGNPHIVFVVDDVDAVDIATLGPVIEHHHHFPDRVNVEFIHILDRSTIRMRVWERGTGITQACGTGACASHVAAHARGLVEATTRIMMDGGALTITYDGQSPLIMDGGFSYNFSGVVTV